jgi:hypothetical protein
LAPCPWYPPPESICSQCSEVSRSQTNINILHAHTQDCSFSPIPGTICGFHISHHSPSLLPKAPNGKLIPSTISSRSLLHCTDLCSSIFIESVTSPGWAVRVKAFSCYNTRDWGADV